MCLTVLECVNFAILCFACDCSEVAFKLRMLRLVAVAVSIVVAVATKWSEAKLSEVKRKFSCFWGCSCSGIYLATLGIFDDGTPFSLWYWAKSFWAVSLGSESLFTFCLFFLLLLPGFPPRSIFFKLVIS